MKVIRGGALDRGVYGRGNGENPEGDDEEGKDGDEEEEEEEEEEDGEEDIILLEKLIELEKVDAEHTEKQNNSAADLEQVVCEINVKEQLLESLKSNILKKKGYEQKYHELQQEVQRLEKEKSKMGKTRAGKSRDLKRIEILEGKLAELRKQLSKKQEALRIIAREAERARKLDKSIQALKAARCE